MTAAVYRSSWAAPTPAPQTLSPFTPPMTGPVRSPDAHCQAVQIMMRRLRSMMVHVQTAGVGCIPFSRLGQDTLQITCSLDACPTHTRLQAAGWPQAVLTLQHPTITPLRLHMMATRVSTRSWVALTHTPSTTSPRRKWSGRRVIVRCQGTAALYPVRSTMIP